MDITKILEDLRQERTQLEEAIMSLERLAAGGKRRGRPPAWIAAVKEREPGRLPPAKAKKGRRKNSAPADSGQEA